MNILLMVLTLLILLLGVRMVMANIQITEKENQLLHSYQLSMQGFYTSIQDKLEATRRYRHDLAKRIQTLEMILEQQEGKASNLEKYRQELIKNYDMLRTQEYSKNQVVDAVLALKKQQCAEKQIDLQMLIERESFSWIKDEDMVALLFNLLDNAVEACERIVDTGERRIRFSMGQTGEQIQMELSNSVPKLEKVVFKTSKPSKEEHGMGTLIIQDVINKYHGTKEVRHDREKHMFCEKITLDKAEEKQLGEKSI